MLEGCTGQCLRSVCIESAYVVGAYITDKLLKTARQYPWRLASGDIEQTLVGLAALQETGHLDDTTKKVHQLLKIGVSKATCTGALQWWNKAMVLLL